MAQGVFGFLAQEEAQKRETFLFGVDGGHLALDAAQAAGVAGNDFFFTPGIFRRAIPLFYLCLQTFPINLNQPASRAFLDRGAAR